MAHAHPHDPPEAVQIAAAVTAARAFIVGWLTLDQQLRRQRLEGVAAEALIAAFDVGVACGEALLRRMGDPGLPAEEVVVPARLVVRSSSGPAPTRA